MKKLATRFCALLLALTCCVGLAGEALASTRASFYLSIYTADVSNVGGGLIQVRFNVTANHVATELGASYILLEESSNGGRTWHVAKEYEDESWMTATNRSTYGSGILYQGTVGCLYRVTADVFANEGSEGDERTTDTSPVVEATW